MVYARDFFIIALGGIVPGVGLRNSYSPKPKPRSVAAPGATGKVKGFCFGLFTAQGFGVSWFRGFGFRD